MNAIPEPIFHYGLPGGNAPLACEVEGPARVIVCGGRRGLNTQSIHARVRLPRHNLGQDRGALTFWALALEDISTFAPVETIERFDPLYRNYTLLADHENPRDWTRASFAFAVWCYWYPGLFVKMYPGDWWRPAFEPMSGDWPAGYVPKFRPLAAAGHFAMPRLTWLQFGFAWDKPGSQYRLYANGVLTGHSNTFAKEIEASPVGETLYAGHPCLALADWKFYAAALEGAAFAELFKAEAASVDETWQSQLRRTYAGEDLPRWDWQPDAGWELQLDAPLNRPENLELFTVQGKPDAAQITPDGMLVTTNPRRTPAPAAWDGGPTGESGDVDQVYYWTRQSFEGEVAVEVDFKPLAHNGLALLMVQASGMAREDFLRDYPPRRSGGMRIVCWENVRNYHWEFFREMDDCRNDVASHALIKNPWFRPLAYGCQPARIELDHWHTLRFVQEGGRLRGTIDGSVVADARDDASINCGPVYTAGHVALRCMFRTRMLFRNLRVYTRGRGFEVERAL